MGRGSVGLDGAWVCRCVFFFFFQAEDGIRDVAVTGVQTCALPISSASGSTTPTSTRSRRRRAGAATRGRACGRCSRSACRTFEGSEASMRFCIQQLLTFRDWQTEAGVYADALEEARLADELGFEAIWLAEHHFSSYGICPSLAVLAAAIARETRRARIGTSVVVAPFAHPLRIAEEWAMVDILSGGRLEFGLGRGYQPNEFRGFGVSMERTRERSDECLEIIRRAWTEERVTFEGEFYTVRDVRVLPKPIQKPHPPF